MPIDTDWHFAKPNSQIATPAFPQESARPVRLRSLSSTLIVGRGLVGEVLRARRLLLQQLRWVNPEIHPPGAVIHDRARMPLLCADGSDARAQPRRLKSEWYYSTRLRPRAFQSLSCGLFVAITVVLAIRLATFCPTCEAAEEETSRGSRSSPLRRQQTAI